MLISGKKVTIRQPSVNDEVSFIGAVKRCADYHHPWVSPPANKQDYLNYIQQCSNENQGSFLVFVQETGELAGVFNLSNIVRGCFQNAYLGYYTFLPNSKKGYMSEALSLIINYAFFNLYLHRIEVNIQPENNASINLIKRQGFVEEGYAKSYLKINGFWRDHIHFSLTLERAQEFWIQQAHNKDKPWEPDFEFTATELEKFLIENESSLGAIEKPKLLDHGWDNDVYCVNNYIFRCPRRQIAASLIRRENIALDLLQGKLNVQIPNPKFKYVGPSQYRIPFHGYKMLDGIPLYKGSLSKQDRAENIKDFALFLKQLHGVSIKDVLDAGLGPQVFDRTIKENILKQIDYRVELVQLDSDLVDYKNQIKELCQLLQSVTLDKSQLVLVHGDLYSKHLFFENKKLSGVIDWGDVGLNHPVVDLAALYSIFPKDSHSSFYGIYGSVSDEVKLYAKFLAVHSALACLEFAKSHDDAQLETEAIYSLFLLFE